MRTWNQNTVNLFHLFSRQTETMQSWEGGNTVLAKLGKASLWREGERKATWTKGKRKGTCPWRGKKINQLDLLFPVSRTQDQSHMQPCVLWDSCVSFQQICLSSFESVSVFNKQMIPKTLKFSKWWIFVCYPNEPMSTFCSIRSEQGFPLRPWHPAGPPTLHPPLKE